jgi:hypothetical protein
MGYQEPDASGVQLRCLQRALRQLMEGGFKVENEWKQQLVLNSKGRKLDKKTSQWWKTRKVDKNTYVWLGTNILVD